MEVNQCCLCVTPELMVALCKDFLKCCSRFWLDRESKKIEVEKNSWVVSVRIVVVFMFAAQCIERGEEKENRVSSRAAAGRKNVRNWWKGYLQPSLEDTNMHTCIDVRWRQREIGKNSLNIGEEDAIRQCMWKMVVGKVSQRQTGIRTGRTESW